MKEREIAILVDSAGAKPAALLHWICEWLGVQAGDAVDDLFPGSGGDRVS